MNQIQDGQRSTVFEYDLQLFFVVFFVNGTNINSVELYKPVLEYSTPTNASVAVAIPAPSAVGVSGIEFKSLASLLGTTSGSRVVWQRDYTQAIIDSFIEKYTTKAVIRRVQ